MEFDFIAVNHGSVWTIKAVSPEAIAFEGWSVLIN